MSPVSELYDQLFHFESRRRSGVYPIHKKLVFDHNEINTFDWITGKVEFQKEEGILDLGCGTGYCLIELAKNKGIKGTGVSVSENEIKLARKWTQQLGLNDSVDFKTQNFEYPIDGKYQKILAIESLKHSKNLEKSINHLSQTLHKDGHWIIADDFVNTSNDLISKQIKNWHSPAFLSLNNFLSILTSSGTFEISTYDLSSHVKTRKVFLLKLQIRIVSLLLFFSNKNSLIRTYLGGLQLEYLYTKGDVSYHVLIAKKK